VLALSNYTGFAIAKFYRAVPFIFRLGRGAFIPLPKFHNYQISFDANFRFPTNYHALSVAGWALFGGFIGFVTLRSNKLMKGKTGGKWLKLFTFLLLTEAIIAWFILGKYYI
jgi:hypothetical protein